ncbi:MAG TPA: DUF3999 family protein [Verrucomicrobiae bacterium]|jgi:hypothetical protein
MKRNLNFLLALAFGVFTLAMFSASAAPLPSAWQHNQPFEISTTGLVKINLPVETLDAARPALEDLRLYDDLSNEIPYVIERPMPRPKLVQNAKSSQTSLNADNTVITLETGLSTAIGSVTLESPSTDFIKAVRVESSDDGNNWQTVADGQPIFRQPSGASQFEVSFPARIAKWLRLTVDDRRSQPIPFTGAVVHATEGTPAPTETIPVTISERNENPGETRLVLNLGAANLDVASVRFETTDPLFMRRVSIAVPKILEDYVGEQNIGRGTIYRVAVEGQASSEKLSMPLEALVHSRQLILLVYNGDSPPLKVSSVSVERRPLQLVFLAQKPGVYNLLTGNARCSAPRYDLAAMKLNLKDVAISAIKIPPPVENPDFRAPEVLSGVEIQGAALNVADWRFRKPVKISSGGAQQLELDLDVLSRAQPDFSDLRVLQGSNQVPYIIERTSINRAISPTVQSTNDSRYSGGLSRWTIVFPKSNLPLTRLSCITTSPLFQRNILLYEELLDDRGSAYRRELGSFLWVQTPEQKSREALLPLNGALKGNQIFLETRNDDNPPIKLEKFAGYYLVTRILFKTASDEGLSLYYGNQNVSQPRYDLSLVAGQLLSADRKVASTLDEERLKTTSWRDTQTPGTGGVLFWGILAVVVVVLLIVIARLLPKQQPPLNP